MSRKKDIAALDELFVEAGLYRKSEEYMELMQFIRRFRTLAPYNAFLIHMQRPDSRFVATAGEWRERFGRTVREGARPMVILMPFAPVWFVYDIEDTEGEPVREYLVDPWACGGRLPSNHWENLLQNLARMGIHYREEALDMRH
ncbi:MAG: hypothetical protein Q4F72_12315, partial [Desulfovibrionaceae bacterium]|nr:hypothetical protein [Desulfovibrionaceae bacterium]